MIWRPIVAEKITEHSVIDDCSRSHLQSSFYTLIIYSWFERKFTTKANITRLRQRAVKETALRPGNRYDGEGWLLTTEPAVVSRSGSNLQRILYRNHNLYHVLSHIQNQFKLYPYIRLSKSYFGDFLNLAHFSLKATQCTQVANCK